MSGPQCLCELPRFDQFLETCRRLKLFKVIFMLRS